MSNSNIELRFVDFSVMEDNNTDELTVAGYVNEVGKYSHTLGKRKKFKERILPGAFERALSINDEIHFLAEHDPNKILASTRNNSLQLVEDEKGLLMTAKITPTSYGKDYHTLIKDGILRNMSFGFNVLKDNWKKLNDGTYTRDIQDLVLYEVSVVTNPAYPQSTISARGLNLIEEVEIPNDIVEEENMPNEVENKELVENEENQQENVEIVEEVVEEEVVKDEEEQQEQQENVEKEETQRSEETSKIEKRAYIGGVYGQYDVMNISLEISAYCASMARYYASTEVKPEMVKKFKDFAKFCSDLMLEQVVEPEVQQEPDLVVVSERSEEKEVVEERDNEVEVETEVEERKLEDYYKMLEDLK